MNYYEDFDYDERYYEPTEVEEKFNELKHSLMDIMKTKIKDEIQNTKNENKELKRENEKLKEKLEDIEYRERELKRKEESLKADNEINFFKTKFEELLKPYEEQITIYYIDYKYKKIKKCKKCNKERKIIYKSEYGDTIEQKCECDVSYKHYIVKKGMLNTLSICKRFRNKDIVIKPKYSYDRNSSYYDDDYLYYELENVHNKFDINEVENYKEYKEYFFDKEECQKYCDYMNKKENIKSE